MLLFNSIPWMADICVQVGDRKMTYIDLVGLIIVYLIVKELKD